MNYSFFQKFCLATAIPLCFSASVVHAANVETLTIKKQSSHYMDMGITRIAVGDPDIANVVQLPGSASEFLIVTKANPGSTALFVWTMDGVRHEYMIVVSPEDYGQAMLIEQAIGLPNVHVKMVGERILLTGTVENQYEKNYALQTARLFVDGGTESSLLVGSGFDMKLDVQESKSSSSGNVEASKSESNGEIIDLLQVLHPTQIRLEAQIIEINSENAKDIGIQYSAGDFSPGIFNVGEGSSDVDDPRQSYSRVSEPRHFKNNPIKWIEQHFYPINAMITALVTKGKARILSRPSVMTLSGEQATIQIGGRIPYSTSNAYGTNIELVDIGIILQFKPIVDSQNRIISVIHTEVSNLNGETATGQPIIATRRADSVMNLNSGLPIVIGGLMDSSETKNVSKIPLLGDIPILGEFFKYTSKSRDKRELIIVVTPYLVGAEETSQSPMSAAMRQWYEQEQQYRDAMENFNFKQPEETQTVIDEDSSRILPPPRYPTNNKTTDTPFKK